MKSILLILLASAVCFSKSSLLAGMKYRQQITINKSYVYVKDTVYRPAILKMESLAVFGAGHKTTGTDLVITDSNLNVITSKILYIDTANSVGEIAFQVKYDSSRNQTYYALWGRPNFVYVGGYSLGDSCVGYYNMSSAPATARGLYDQSEGGVFLDTVGQGWSDTQLVSGIWHKAIQFNGGARYFKSPAYSINYFNMTRNYTARGLFYFDQNAVTSMIFDVGNLGALFFQITTGGTTIYWSAGTGVNGNDYTATSFSSIGWYDISITNDTTNHIAKCFVNGDSIKSFAIHPGLTNVDRLVVGARPMGSTYCVEKISLVSAYQEVQSPAVVKTLASNFKNYNNLFVFADYGGFWYGGEVKRLHMGTGNGTGL